MMRTIHLYGRLKDKFGPKYTFDVDTAAEGFRALSVTLGNPFLNEIKLGSYRVIRGRRHGGMELDINLICNMKLGSADLHVIPVPHGARNKGGIKAVIGIAIVGAAIFFSGGTLAAPLAGTVEAKALRVSTDPNAGYFAPAEFSTEFVRNLVEFSPIRSVASVKVTGQPSVILGKRTGVTNAKWQGENEVSESSEPAFGQLEIPTHEMTTYTDISNQLLQDAVADVEGEVRLALTEDFGAKEGAGFVIGDGQKKPKGFMTNSDIAFSLNGHATDLKADALITLMYAVPAFYRNAGVWVMNGTTLATLRKLKDGQGNYLWQPSYQAGQPETVLGRPVVEAVDMPDIGDGKFPIIFGNFAGYRILDRVDLSVLVNPYSLATTGMTRFHATRRVGGDVIQPRAFRKLKMATS